MTADNFWQLKIKTLISKVLVSSLKHEVICTFREENAKKY